MTVKTWVMLIGGLLVGFFAAFLLVPVLLPGIFGKPIGFNDNWWGMGPWWIISRNCLSRRFFLLEKQEKRALSQNILNQDIGEGLIPCWWKK